MNKKSILLFLMFLILVFTWSCNDDLTDTLTEDTREKFPELELWLGTVKVEGASITLPTMYVNSLTEMTFTLVNSGEADLVFDESEIITFLGDNAALCSVQVVPKLRLIPDDSDDITISIEPDSSGTFMAEFRINTDSESIGDVTFTITGTVLAERLPGIELYYQTLPVSKESSVELSNMTVNSSYDYSFKILNNGDADLELPDTDRVTFTGTDADACSLTALPDKQIGAGNETTFTISVTPDTVGEFSAGFTVNTESDPPGNVSYGLSSTIFAEPQADMQLSYLSSPVAKDSTIDLSDMTVNSSSSYTFTILNTGEADLELPDTDRVTFTGTDADACSLTAVPDKQIGAGNESTFTISITPDTVGEFNAGFSINAVSDPPGVVSYGLSSTILEEPQAELKLSFGEDELNPAVTYPLPVMDVNEDYYLDFTIENTGDADLVLPDLERIGISGGAADDCTVWDRPDKIISQGNSSVFTVKARPTLIGTFDLTLTVNTVDSEIGSVNYSFDSTVAAEPVPLIEVWHESAEVSSPVDFGDQHVDWEPITLDFEIKNVGTADLTLTGSPYVELSGDGYTCTQPSNNTIASGEGLSFQVTLTTDEVTQYIGSMTIESDSDENSTYSVSFTGDGVAQPQLETVVASVSGTDGPFNENQSVTLSYPGDETGVEIYYTQESEDGNKPTPSSSDGSLYGGETITINRNDTIWAIAYKEDTEPHQPSDTMVEEYTLKCPTPVITPTSDYIGPPNNYFSFTCAATGASIYYTINGTVPNNTGNGTLYGSGNIEVPEVDNSENTYEIRAIAYKSNWDDSDVTGTRTITTTSTVRTPVLSSRTSPGETGFLSQGQEIGITCGTTGAVIRYTMDGSTPTSSSPIASSDGEGDYVTVNGYNTTVKARGFRSDWATSLTGEEEFYIPFYYYDDVPSAVTGLYYLYNSSAQKYYKLGVTMYPNDNTLERYSNTGSLEASDTITYATSDLIASNGSGLIFMATHTSMYEEYSFTGTTISGPLDSSTWGTDNPKFLAESDDDFYTYEQLGDIEIKRRSKSNLDSDGTYTINDGGSGAIYGGCGGSYLFFMRSNENTVYRMGLTGTGQTSQDLSEFTSGILSVAEYPGGSYLTVTSSGTTYVYDQNFNFLMDISSTFTYIKSETPYSNVVDVYTDGGVRKYYTVNTTVD